MQSNLRKMAFFAPGIAIGLVTAIAIVVPQRAVAVSSANESIDFVRDIQPVLVSNCYGCHGATQQKKGLRLDQRDSVLKHEDHVVVAGDLAASALIKRVTSADPDAVMPPKGKGTPLTEQQVALLKRWIDQGAVWPDAAAQGPDPRKDHWAFKRPIRPDVPVVQKRDWVRTPIDSFILEKLEKEGLSPSSEADRSTLIRRVTMDLTGLPPTLQDVDLFVNDASPGAYERLVDRLLASPAYGERWAQVWLDLARYADSKGYAEDSPRSIWKFRDWVINSINENKHYDEFTIEQLAGDMLPKPTNDQIIATAFHRNTLENDEGGTDDEEFRVAAVVDRVNTTFQTWMGLSMACAQCHDHKFDPISQKEYFGAFAIFNQTEDADRRDEAPTLAIPDEKPNVEVAKIDAQIASVQKIIKDRAEAKLAGKPMPVLAAKPNKSAKPESDSVAAPESVATPESSAERSPSEKPGDAPAAAPAKKSRKAAAKKPAPTETGKAGEKFDPDKPQPTASGPKLSPEELKDKNFQIQLDNLKKQRAKYLPEGIPVMRELPADKRRRTQMFFRGNFQDKGPEIAETTPAFLPQMPASMPKNRLTLARWVMSAENPLTARVLTNRLWEQLFGTGLVESSEDFGVRCAPPSHPSLLDWLATEAIRLDWDTKALVRLMVTSATYRQTSKVTPELLEKDPYNRWLARGPRVRASAEDVRDQALFVSGLLSHKMLGPSVRPPQPKFGLKAAFGRTTDWDDSTGEDRYRRGLYTSWRRSQPYPSMLTFDAPERSVCAVRRTRTNTPLQALTTLNDPVFVEAAQALGRRIFREGGDTTESRAAYGLRLCMARIPDKGEIERLVALYAKAHAQFAEDAAAAKKMATEPIGALPKNADVTDMASWSVVGNVLLNLDEMFLKR